VLAAAADVAACLGECDGFSGAPGSPYVSFDGILRGIEFARRSGSDSVRAVPGSLLERLIGSDTLREEYFCSFETNAAFIPRWEAAGLRVAARGPQDEMRALELPAKSFHVATLFQPQLSSSFVSPHPIVEGFLRACSGQLP
jgi:CTP synthase (UTP-ammonia lyase)